jgi:adenylate kinase family enzyme
MRLVILTGASGSGKTTIAERIEQQDAGRTRVFRFDSIGVPSPEERLARWGVELLDTSKISIDESVEYVREGLGTRDDR